MRLTATGNSHLEARMRLTMQQRQAVVAMRRSWKHNAISNTCLNRSNLPLPFPLSSLNWQMRNQNQPNSLTMLHVHNAAFIQYQENKPPYARREVAVAAPIFFSGLLHLTDFSTSVKCAASGYGCWGEDSNRES